MKTFDPAVQTGMLLEVTAESSKKKKKIQKAEKVQSSKVSQAEEVEKEETFTKAKKEIIPSKSGVLKKLLKSLTTTSSPNIRKTEVSSKGATFHDVPAPVSPGSKRKRAQDVAKHMQQTLSKKRKLIICNESSDEEVVPETPPVSVVVTVSLPPVSIPITSQISTTTSIPLEVVTTKSVSKEVPTSDMVVNVSDTGAPITSVETTLPINLSASLPISSENISTSLPPFSLPTTTITTSSIFDHPLQHPFTTLFPSQSPETPQPSQPMSDDENEGGGFGGTFEALHFDSEEEEIPDHMLMSGKQFKILNRKLNAIIQSQVDSGSKSTMTGLEVEYLLKEVKKRILDKVDQSDKNNELRIKAQGSSFNGVVNELKNIAKERHVLLVQDVKKVREDVNFKIEELKQELAKELHDITSQNLEVQKRVDVVATALNKVITDSQSPSLILEANQKENKEKFDKLIQLVTELKTLVSQPTSQTILTLEFLSLKVNTLEQAIQKALALIANFTSLLPKNAPPAFIGVQGGEKKASKEDDAKTVGKVISTQLKTTLPVFTKPISSTVTTTKPISEGITIGSKDGGSSSAKSSTENTGKGEGIAYEKSKEEKKAEAEAEMERLRQVQSIMRQRVSDPPTMNKGDPAKLYSYEIIESKVLGNHLYEFEKKPRKSYDVANSDRSQLDFPINEMMFITAQYKISEKLDNVDEYTYLKIRFHAVLAKDQEEVWSLMKIKKVLTIKKDVMFEDMLQNF
ncbi:uncharacterized protein LOC128125976 [Lactuca sativa]|uniref:uncharacterized protein LOC128125976 n=1 Tax=Lactuca sativa TaxID=4236 RepID=UPI0022B050C8|nr:uncharacterized protein LOC128125976 [Lactuca sativa]